MRANSRPAERAVAQTLDRRRKDRHETCGEVVLNLAQPEPVEISAELVDLSPDGFRATHQYKALCTGQQVRFRHTQAEGAAEVAWNRVLKDRVETGFLILTNSIA